MREFHRFCPWRARAALVVCTLAAFSLLTQACSAGPIVSFVNNSDARLVHVIASGDRDDNNGGNTISGALIGIGGAAPGVDNFMVYEFPTLGSLAGEEIESVNVVITVRTAFSSGTHGSVDDIIHLNEIALPNSGFFTGTSVITGADTPADDGSVSYLNRVQFNGSGTTEPWLDAGGSPVADLSGAISSIATRPGYNVGEAPAELIFPIDLAVAQDWIDSGLAGLALSNIDDGDGRSRFNMAVNGATIEVELVPEPTAAMLVGSLLAAGCLSRRRRS